MLNDGPPRQLTAAEVLPDVLVPDRLAGLRVDAVQVSQRPAGVDAIAIHRRGRPRSGKHELAGRVIRETPELLAAGQVEDPELVPDLLIPVEQIDLAVADRRTAETQADRHRPKHCRTFLWPGSQQTLLIGGAVSCRPIDPRPVCGEGAGDRQHDHHRYESSRVSLIVATPLPKALPPPQATARAWHLKLIALRSHGPRVALIPP